MGSGTTLVEVVAALAIAGTLLTALVVANARYQRQWNLCQRKIAATAAADDLLSNWWSNAKAVPIKAEGLYPADESMRWQTVPVQNAAIEAIGGATVRLTIAEATVPGSPTLVSVDIVISHGATVDQLQTK